MRWHKCDLHMHTAIDALHWRGGDIVGDDDATRKDFAKRYIARCYEVGLSVIAVTEHNFLSKEFLPYLTNAIQTQAPEHGYEIVLFPGFEIEADVGKGTHVIALFEPDSDLDTIDHLLSACGVAHPRSTDGTLAKSTQRLPEILKAVQKHDSLNGLVTIPHVMDHGLFDNDRISEWLQVEEHRNSHLLAVEVPKPVSQMSNGFQKLFGNGEDCDQAWKRERPIATVMSSDCKALDGDEEDDFGYIGRRYSWIKMSKPSIEALRQAFLDHDSRIRLPVDRATDSCPDDVQRHGRINSVTVRGCEFLDDHVIHFSPNLNCLIGSRGSGKSSILEAMRLTLGKDADSELDQQTKEKIDRARRLVEGNAHTTVTLEWQNSDGVCDTVEFKKGRGQFFTSSVRDRNLQDVGLFLEALPIQFFSQLQLNSVAQASKNRLRGVLDDFVRDELAPLESEEEEKQGEITRLYAVADQYFATAKEIRRLTQEIEELDRSWEKRASLKDAADEYQTAKRERAYATSVLQEVPNVKDDDGAEGFKTDDSPEAEDSVLASLLAAVDETITDIVLPEDWTGWPHRNFLSQLTAKRNQARESLRQAVSDAVKQYQETIKSAFECNEWEQIDTDLQASLQSFQDACKEAGLTEEDVNRLQEIDTKRTEKNEELKAKRDEATELKADVDRLPAVFSELHALWCKQYECRKQAVDTINKEARTGNRSLITVDVEFCGDRSSFLEIWNSLYSDGRTLAGKNWQDIGELFFSEFSKQLRAPTLPQLREVSEADEPTDDVPRCSIWHMLDRWFSDATTTPESVTERLTEVRVPVPDIASILLGEQRGKWLAARKKRVDDAVDLTLYRADGTSAGCISEGRLSDGQRNTAVLALLLAHGKSPLIIDQPEDELDSSFVYRELLPMLRTVKNRRQLIFVTHNPNLPVNGDADLVYALHTEDGCGKKLAEGGLDRPEVSDAVLEIMEGSDEAFRKRREKYNF